MNTTTDSPSLITGEGKEEGLFSLAYQRLTMNFPQAAIELYHTAGTAEEIYAHRKDIREVAPDATDAFCRTLNISWDSYLSWAENELKWCEKKKIRYLHASHPDYPQRLLNCTDAPIGLFYLGNTELNSPHIISIVGTRQSTHYGHDMIHRIICDMKRMVPDLLVVSGLAYGIDVCAHREALANGMNTVGVLAHGLDTMYPASHRNTAAEMVRQGGLLTEYPSQTRGDRQNFLRRNRIVAGIADCTIVAESMEHGGSLVTARIANDYGRDVFAFPGRVGDKASEGCNDLIRKNKAIMLTSAQDIVDALGWQTVQEEKAIRSQGIQTDLFPTLSGEQKIIVDALKDNDLQVNILTSKTGLHISRVNAILFELEMMGIVKPYAGGTYHLQTLPSPIGFP